MSWPAKYIFLFLVSWVKYGIFSSSVAEPFDRERKKRRNCANWCENRWKNLHLVLLFFLNLEIYLNTYKNNCLGTVRFLADFDLVSLIFFFFKLSALWWFKLSFHCHFVRHPNAVHKYRSKRSISLHVTTVCYDTLWFSAHCAVL